MPFALELKMRVSADRYLFGLDCKAFFAASIDIKKYLPAEQEETQVYHLVKLQQDSHFLLLSL